MTPDLIENAKGAYKSEWDSPSTDLPAVPDYEEIFIWDETPGARSVDGINPEDGQIGDFTHPDFFENIGGSMTGVRGGELEDGESGRSIGKSASKMISLLRSKFLSSNCRWTRCKTILPPVAGPCTSMFWNRMYTNVRWYARIRPCDCYGRSLYSTQCKGWNYYIGCP
jgi:hypothetical protein